jgi:O-antigen ligase
MEFQLDNFSIRLMTWQIMIFFVLAFWLYCLVDVLRNSFNGSEKLIWILVLLFVPFFGPLLYQLIGRNKKIIND